MASQRDFTKAARASIWAALLLSPLMFGTVELWSLLVIGALCALALLLTGLSGLANAESSKYMAPLWIILIIGAVQLIPLPGSAITAMSPSAGEIYANTIGSVTPASWATISLSPRATLMEIVRLGMLAAFFFAMISSFTNTRQYDSLVFTVVLAGGLMAVSGILQSALAPGTVLWFREAPAGATPFGPFVNRNHWGGFMLMVFWLAMAETLIRMPQLQYEGFINRLQELTRTPGSWKLALSAASAVFILASIVASGSRGAALALALSALVAAALLWRGRGAIPAIAALFAIATAWGLHTGRGLLLERLSEGADFSRLQAWQNTLTYLRDYWLTGSGLGSFEYIYPSYTSGAAADRILRHAHNDYLEMAATGGVIFMAAALWFALLVTRSALRASSKHSEGRRHYLSACALAGIAGVAAHSALDFGLQIQANALYMAFLCALIVLAGGPAVRHGGVARRKPVMAAAIALIALVVAVYGGGICAQHAKAPGVRVIADPLNPRHWHALGSRAMSEGRKDDALRLLARATALGPADPMVLQRTALACSAETAGRLFRQSIKLAPHNALLHRQYAAWLLSEGLRQEARGVIANGIAIAPKDAAAFITLMNLTGIRPEEMRDYMPKGNAEARLALGTFLRRIGLSALADEAYTDALSLLAMPEAAAKPRHYAAIAYYFLSTGRPDMARKAVQQGLAAFPKDQGLRKIITPAN